MSLQEGTRIIEIHGEKEVRIGDKSYAAINLEMPRIASNHQKLEEAGWTPSYSCLREQGPTDTLFRISSRQNYERTNFSYFRPPSL